MISRNSHLLWNCSPIASGTLVCWRTCRRLYMLSARIGSSTKNGRYCSTARQNWIASRLIDAGVEVEAELDVVAERLAQRLELADALADGPGRLEQVAVGERIAEAPAHELPALVDVLLGVLDQRLDAVAALDVRVADDLVADEAAEQLVDRDVRAPCP